MTYTAYSRSVQMELTAKTSQKKRFELSSSSTHQVNFVFVLLRDEVCSRSSKRVRLCFAVRSFVYFCFLFVISGVGPSCTYKTPSPSVAAGRKAESVSNPAVSPLYGVLSEETFAALHQHREHSSYELKGEDIEIGGERAYLSIPQEGKSSGAVLVIHEWWGLNEHIRRWTDRLADEGYAALAIDLYKGEVAIRAQDARRLMKRVRTEEAQLILHAGLTFLRQDSRVRATKVATIGWCFGGGWSLRAALLDARLDGVVMYYGRPITEASTLKQINAKLLGIFGQRDSSISSAMVDDFRGALDEAGVTATIKVFDAEHAFANPSSARYNAPKAAQAWLETRVFLRQVLRGT